MVSTSSGSWPSVLGKQARERYVAGVAAALPAIGEACRDALQALMEAPGTARERQDRRDAWVALQAAHAAWAQGCVQALQAALRPPAPPRPAGADAPDIGLLDQAVVERQILASRLATRVLDVAASELNALRLRLQFLERLAELPKDDVLLPDVTAGVLVEQWLAQSLPRSAWQMVQDALVPRLGQAMCAAYGQANAFLVDNGVMREIDLSALVRRSPEGPVAPLPPSVPPAPPAVQDETRMLTGTTPLARARLRAQGVMQRLRNLVSERTGREFGATQTAVVSPVLQEAMVAMSPSAAVGVALDDTVPLEGAAAAAYVAREAQALRERSAALKRVARTPSERAVVEVVALMFQAILAEERIPASVRVWFARLQIPVLRVALAEPEFFHSLQHPARKLIDRMGACVMGFEATLGASALEAEIRRVVQVVEQYPETGRRVFQLVYDEFEKFLAQQLATQPVASRLVPIAQQVEQKETLAVQYTIELRKLLDGVAAPEQVRHFLFHVWVDVIAVAGVKHGAKHPDTVALKRVAVDLLWSASAKPSRAERAQVLQRLPALLQRLRQGMALLGYPPGVQDAHIKGLNDALAAAFMARTEVIPPEALARLSQRLANLEAYLSEVDVDDIELNSESIELITGVDADRIEVIRSGGSQPAAAMRAWVAELPIGDGFRLDHGGRVTDVQLVWRSQRGLLLLFVGNAGRCYLMPAARVAAYLQAGLLLPADEEALTVRATRDALAKLDADPERLLAV